MKLSEIMLRLSECINEGFFGNGYDRYKRKVLDALASIGILIDEEKMKWAEERIRDFYADKMDAYDCASAVRDELRRYRAPVTEAFENYASEIIDSAPESKRKNAVALIKSMDNIKKAHFDNCIMRIAEKKKMDPKGVVKARGFDIMELVNDGKQAPSQIVDSISRQLLDTKEPMSVKEALEIIKESGKKIDVGNEISIGTYLCTRGFTHSNMGTLFKRGREYDVKEIREDGHVLVGGFWVSQDFFQEHFMPLN